LSKIVTFALQDKVSGQTRAKLGRPVAWPKQLMDLNGIKKKP